MHTAIRDSTLEESMEIPRVMHPNKTMYYGTAIAGKVSNMNNHLLAIRNQRLNIAIAAAVLLVAHCGPTLAQPHAGPTAGECDDFNQHGCAGAGRQ